MGHIIHTTFRPQQTRIIPSTCHADQRAAVAYTHIYIDTHESTRDIHNYTYFELAAAALRQIRVKRGLKKRDIVCGMRTPHPRALASALDSLAFPSPSLALIHTRSQQPAAPTSSIASSMSVRVYVYSCMMSVSGGGFSVWEEG